MLDTPSAGNNDEETTLDDVERPSLGRIILPSYDWVCGGIAMGNLLPSSRIGEKAPKNEKRRGKHILHQKIERRRAITD